VILIVGVFTVIFMLPVTPLQNQTTELKITKKLNTVVPIKLQSTGPPCPRLPWLFDLG